MEPDNKQSVTESLYKQNLELAAKNKTLSILGKLYEISILNLEPKELAEKITKTIQTDFSLELVGILFYKENASTLFPMAFSESERLNKVESDHQTFFDKIDLPYGGETFLTRVVTEKKMGYTENPKDIWGSLIPEAMYTSMKEDGHMVSFLAYPLIIGEKTMGILLISLNRDYDHLINYEKESFKSFVNVIAVAIDKSIIYKKLRLTNEELETANDKLKELDQLKSEFLSLATHQIRAPLTAIKGYSSMLLEGDFGSLPQKAKNSVETIMKSCQNLIDVVGDFLNISRIEQGRMVYEKSDFSLAQLVKEVLDELKPNIQNAKLSLDLEIPQNLNTNIKADRGKIKQVLGNVIDNAIKYTLKGGIKVSVYEEGNMVKVKVKDSGVGIPRNEIGKLFAKFSRTKDAKKTNVTGTGLGLYIAKKMVEAHRGDLTVESEGEGKGSTFIITLPKSA